MAGEFVPTTKYRLPGKISDGKSVKVNVTNSGGSAVTYEAGKWYLLGGFLGLCMKTVTIAAGAKADVVLNIEPAEYETDQINTADAFNVGDAVYWDATNNRFTTTAAGNRFVGRVTAAKDSNNVIWFVLASQDEPLAQAASVAALTDNTGGTADANNTLAAVEATYTQATIANNFATLAAKVNEIITALKSAGLMA